MLLQLADELGEGPAGRSQLAGPVACQVRISQPGGGVGLPLRRHPLGRLACALHSKALFVSPL